MGGVGGRWWVVGGGSREWKIFSARVHKLSA